MNGPLDVRRVVLVVLDGSRPDAVEAFDLMQIRHLAASGASSYTRRTVTPSITAAAMTTLLTGPTPAMHGIVSERFHIPRVRGPVDPNPDPFT